MRRSKKKPVPRKRKSSAKEPAAAIARMQKLSSGLSLRGLKVKDLRSEGRR